MEPRAGPALYGQRFGPLALPLEPSRRRPAHYQLRRRQHQFEAPASRSLHGRARPRAGRAGQRRRPGFELALLIEKAVDANPGTDGILLGGHGLFTWGATQRECYLSSIHTIDQMGEFILAHQRKRATVFGGLEHTPVTARKEVAA